MTTADERNIRWVTGAVRNLVRRLKIIGYSTQFPNTEAITHVTVHWVEDGEPRSVDYPAQDAELRWVPARARGARR